MPGHGPIPKHPEQRRRRNKPAVEGLTVQGVNGAVTAPKLDPSWHPTAKDWYESLLATPISRFYQPSDWATAYLAAATLSAALEPVNANLLREFRLLCAGLMTTEGERRRAGVQVTPTEATPATIERARDRLRAL